MNENIKNDEPNNINKMPNEYNLIYLNNMIISNNNHLNDMATKIQAIITDINNKQKTDVIINKLNNIILEINSILEDNKKKLSNLNNRRIDLQLLKNENIDFRINSTIIYPQGKYTGEVKNGICDGKGVYIYNNGDKYEGDFKNNMKDGKGIFYYKLEPWNGDVYVGDYKNNKREGKGIYYFRNGDRYEGDYRNGMSEGKGIMYFSNGDRRMGDYFNNKPIGNHVTLHANGKITTVFFK